MSSVSIVSRWFIEHERAFFVLDILAVVLLFIGLLKSFVDRGILASATIWGLVILAIWIIVMICSYKRRTKF